MTIIDTLHPNDVLLGRGQHVKHDGNQIFRALVRTQAAAYYRATGHHKDSQKDAIARQIIQAFVANGGGRFVKRKVKSISEHDLPFSNDSSSPVVYELADEATVLVKVKQTMRDYSVCLRREKAAEQKSRRQGGATASATAKVAVSARHSRIIGAPAAAAAANGTSNGSNAATALLQRQLPQQQDEQLTQMMRVSIPAHSELDDHRLFLAALGRQNLALNTESTNIPSVATGSSNNPVFLSLDVTNQALQLLLATNQNHATLRPHDQEFQQLPPQQNSPSATTILQSQAEQLLLLLQLQMQQQQQQQHPPPQQYSNGNQPAASLWLDAITPQPLPLAAQLPTTGNSTNDSNTSTSTTATASSAAIVSPLFQSVPSGTSTCIPYYSTNGPGTTGSAV